MGRRTLSPEQAKAMSRAAAAKAAGWPSAEAYSDYLDDVDGGRHPVRAHLASLGIDPSPVEFPVSAIEAASWD